MKGTEPCLSSLHTSRPRGLCQFSASTHSRTTLSGSRYIRQQRVSQPDTVLGITGNHEWTITYTLASLTTHSVTELSFKTLRLSAPRADPACMILKATVPSMRQCKLYRPSAAHPSTRKSSDKCLRIESSTQCSSDERYGTEKEL